MKKAVWMYTILGVVLLALAPAAKATILVPGQGPTAATVLPGGFALLATTGGTFSSPTITGTWEAAVLSDPSNVFCAGCLDFQFQVVDVTSKTDSVDRVTMSDFTGFSTDAGYITGFCGIIVCSAGVPKAPATVDRVTADVVGFDFTGGIKKGNGSYIITVETNATKYTTGYVSLIDSLPTYVVAYAPLVPEPATLSLLGFGLLSLFGLRKKQ